MFTAPVDNGEHQASLIGAIDSVAMPRTAITNDNGPRLAYQSDRGEAFGALLRAPDFLDVPIRYDVRAGPDLGRPRFFSEIAE